MAPIIRMSPNVEIKLTAFALATGGYPSGLEFSGLGLIEKEGNIFHIVEVDLLGVGSPGYTEFSPERAHTLPLDPRRKLWFHRHPISGWSGTDERTATKEPLGGIPELVQWAVAIVLTPSGWIGRVDIHVPQLKTFHCPVEPKVATPEVLEAANSWWAANQLQLDEYIKVLKAEFEVLHPSMKNYREDDNRTHSMRWNTQEYKDDDFDIDWEQYGDRVVGDGEGRFYCVDCQCMLNEEGTVDDAAGAAEITTYGCPDCGEYYIMVDAHASTLISEPEVQTRTIKPSSYEPDVPAWKQSTWWDRIRGR